MSTIVYRYTGTAKYQGIPPMDLSQEVVDALSLKHQVALKAGLKGYAKAKKEADKDTDSSTGKEA